MQVTDCTVKNTSSGASDPEALFRTLQAAKTEIDTLRQQLCQARQQLDWFKRQLFGRKSEKRIIDNPHQLDLGELLGDTPVPAEPEPEEITYRRRKRTKQRSEDDVTDSGLRFGPEVPVEVIELSAPQLEGPAAEQYEVIDYKISHRLAQLPGSSLAAPWQLRGDGVPSPDTQAQTERSIDGSASALGGIRRQPGRCQPAGGTAGGHTTCPCTANTSGSRMLASP